MPHDLRRASSTTVGMASFKASQFVWRAGFTLTSINHTWLLSTVRNACNYQQKCCIEIYCKYSYFCIPFTHMIVICLRFMFYYLNGIFTCIFIQTSPTQTYGLSHKKRAKHENIKPKPTFSCTSKTIYEKYIPRNITRFVDI